MINRYMFTFFQQKSLLLKIPENRKNRFDHQISPTLGIVKT